MILLFLLSFSVFIVVDLVWLLKVAPELYKQNIGHLMAQKFNGYAALLFYVLYHVGLIYFVYIPALASGQLIDAIIGGLLFGLLTYGTYDLTNLATLKNWPWKLTVIDLAWGMFITSVTTTIVTFLAQLWEILG